VPKLKLAVPITPGVKFAALRTLQFDEIIDATFFVMPRSTSNPPDALRSDARRHAVADLKMRRGDPDKPSWIHAELAANVVADHNEGRIFADTAVQILPFVRPFDIAIHIVGMHQTARDVVAKNAPSTHVGRGNVLVRMRIIPLSRLVSDTVEHKMQATTTCRATHRASCLGRVRSSNVVL
jgi:hypothetical protein